MHQSPSLHRCYRKALPYTYQPATNPPIGNKPDLLATGVRRDDLYIDHGISGARASRPEFDRALEALIDGDTLVITTFDRLGRSTQNMLAFAEELRARGAGLRVLNLEPVPGLHGDGAWDLRIANLGASMASDVRLSVSPVWSPTDEDDRHTPAIKEVLNDPLTLPPGSHLRLMWRLDRRGDNGRRIVAGAPENTDITVTYKGDIDRKSRRKGYTDKFKVRTDLGKAVPAPTTGAKLNGNENGKELQNIDRALRALNAHVGELRR